MEYKTLNNGIKIPKIGYGVYKVEKEITTQCVLEAIKCGYRHIDTAHYYYNEEEVGRAIIQSNIPREEFFITTKITEAKDYEEACKMIDIALEKLQVSYIDLMLIHWPAGDNLAMYKAMEDYYKEGKLKAIGLSNFYGDSLQEILDNATIMPALNQIEVNVFQAQKEMQEILDKYNIALEAWSPLASGMHNIFENELLLKLASKYNKSVAQIALRYLYQRDIIIIPRSINPKRIKENFDILDFNIDDDDISLIETLDKHKSIFEWE